MENKKARVIAFYLPQFHPIPENDKWFGKGFTEWTNVGKAKPLFYGHYQPRVPADLGYYDLRLPETRNAQANMARECGIEGFCYWHYWFGNGKRLLEKPFNEVLQSGEPDFPFCLAWANTTWKGFQYGSNGRNVLIEQKYPGKVDYEKHFYAVLPSFLDKRYIKVNNKPFFLLHAPQELPDTREFINLWQNLAIKNGLEGIYFVAQSVNVENIQKYLHDGYDSVNIMRFSHILKYERSTFTKIKQRLLKSALVYDYIDAAKYFSGPEDFFEEVIPSIVPNWDHSPRTGKRGFILNNSTPDLFKKHVKEVLKTVELKPLEKRIICLKSWNEWAEGNYMEPDQKFGHGYLNALRSCLIEFA